MALTYTQLDALTTNATFLGRVRTAVRKHATSLLAGPDSERTTVPGSCMLWLAL